MNRNQWMVNTDEQGISLARIGSNRPLHSSRLPLATRPNSVPEAAALDHAQWRTVE
jgi:hypothetical protein